MSFPNEAEKNFGISGFSFLKQHDVPTGPSLKAPKSLHDLNYFFDMSYSC